jgi:hypothetical protein
MKLKKMKFLLTDGGYDDGDKKKDDNGNKRRGPRTTIKAKQLEVLKHFLLVKNKGHFCCYCCCC